MRTLLMTTAAVLLASGGALAQDNDRSQFDLDEDDVVTLEEFREGAGAIELFKLFDRDDDGVITEAELYDETYRQYDRNRDEQWQSEELDEFMSSIRGAGEIDGEPSAN
jgi:hypothetical protein